VAIGKRISINQDIIHYKAGPHSEVQETHWRE